MFSKLIKKRISRLTIVSNPCMKDSAKSIKKVAKDVFHYFKKSDVFRN